MITKEVGIRFEVTSDENWYYGYVYLGDICVHAKLADVRSRMHSEQHMLQALMEEFAKALHPPDSHYDD